MFLPYDHPKQLYLLGRAVNTHGCDQHYIDKDCKTFTHDIREAKIFNSIYHAFFFIQRQWPKENDMVTLFEYEEEVVYIPIAKRMI